MRDQCRCPKCCDQIRREWEERRRELRERHEAEQRKAYRRKHGEDPTIGLLRRLGLLTKEHP